ncbi:M56 family metallopeptidase [Cochleicola gelatinilyticus]|uniref:M56 family metallopeptidase n=1 Tax=Cochleicola gelatinilyticus TaxID=1763537 RepID=UPI001F519BCA|nr:M56 family metallopeptidase [Cochleicola gelatinilyticus]
MNRIILLGIIIASTTLPFLRVPQQLSINKELSNKVTLFNWKSDANSIVTVPTKENREETEATSLIPENDTTTYSLSQILWYAYFGGIALFFIGFLIQFLLLLYKKSRLESIKDGAIKIYELTDNSPPFSFYKWIFINPTLYNNDTYEQIIAHEKVHINQYHSIDMLIAELGIIIFWFNPLMWSLKKSISNNLEFLTDNELIMVGVEPESYQMSLLKVSVPQHPLNFTTNYNQSILQKRITMMNSKKSSAQSSWKYLVLVPMLLLSVSILNATYLPTNNTLGSDTLSTATENKIHREIITKELKFSNKSKNNVLSISNITGAIHIQAFDGDVVKIEIEKVISATSDKELQRGIDEINILTTEDNNGQFVYLDSPQAKYNKLNNELSFQNDCNGKPCFDYTFQMHYTIKVPQGINLNLRTVNGGDILVKDVNTNTIMVNHISGSINLENVSGATNAYTISGGIKASYAENPTQSSTFTTTSGHIELALQNDLDANISYEIQDGKVISEFDSQKTNKHSLKIGKANVDYNFKILSGNVYLNKN